MYVLRELISFELIAAIFIAGIFSYLLGYKKVFAFCMLLSIGPVVIPWLKVWLSNLVPWWAAWLVVIALTIAVIKSFLGLIIGKNAADQAIGQMSASFITRILLAPIRLFKPIYINKAFDGLAYSTRVVAQSAAALNNVRQPGTSNHHGYEPMLRGLRTKYSVGDEIEGQVIEVNNHGLLIEIGDGYLGKVDFKYPKEEEKLTLANKYPVDSRYKGKVIRVGNVDSLLYVS